MAGSDCGFGFGYGSGYGYGYGFGSGFGHDSGYGYGYGYGFCDASGYGDGNRYGDFSGYGYSELVDKCGNHTASVHLVFPVLRIGCEAHTLDHWIANAEEIDRKHGDGISTETRALALKLKAERGLL